MLIASVVAVNQIESQIDKVVTFLIMLSILVVLHEFGHFIVARRNGVRVNEFAVGMGPKLFGWTSPRSGTLYSVRAFPIGGFCAMQGEDGKTSEAEQQREFRETPAAYGTDNFQAKSPWQRLAIVVAGPVANFILAFLILLVGALAFGVAGDHPSTTIASVKPGFPAAAAGMKPFAKIVSIDGKTVTDGNQIVTAFHDSLGKRLTVVFEQGGTQHTVQISPLACPANRKWGCIGIVPATVYQRVSPGEAFRDSGIEFVGIGQQIVGGLGLLITHFTQYGGQTMGVIGMGQAAGVVQDLGWGPYFFLAATISFALGIFNLLPIPALDGGRGAFIIAELIRGKPVDPEKEAFVHFAGFAALMGLMVLVAAHDIMRIASGNGVM